MVNVSIRLAEAADIDAMYEICYLTSHNGGEPPPDPAADRRLVGHHYLGPYPALEPELSFVAEDDLGVCGYIVGAADTATFERRRETEWFPAIREQYPNGTGEGLESLLIAMLYVDLSTDPAILATHPAHLHIDLLPRAQGSGLGRRLMDTMADACRRRGATGLHLGVSRKNERAIGFYRHLGYTTLAEDGLTFTLGVPLR